MENRVYQPIDCNFYDIILAAATLRRPTTLEFYDQTGTLQHQETVIVDVFTQNREEFLQMSTGELVRLDAVVAVGGEQMPASLACSREQ